MNKQEKEPAKPISVYRINKEQPELKDAENIFEGLKDILKTHDKYSAEEKSLKPSSFINYTAAFILYKSLTNTKWEKFAEKILDSSLGFGKYMNYSAILLLECKSGDKNIYAVTFGNIAPHIIEKYIDDSFGLDILSRIIKPEDNSLRSHKGQSVIGIALGESSVYRQLHSLDETKNFGKIFRELNAVLKEGILEKFGFKKEKTFLNCCAKSSFSIKSAITVSGIEKYLDGCEYALKLESNPINTAQVLRSKKDAVLIYELEKQLVHSIYEAISDTTSGIIYDLSHRDFEKYFQAKSYEVGYNRKKYPQAEPITSMSDLLDCISKININSEEDLELLLNKGKIKTLDEEDYVQTEGIIKNHLFAEETKDGKKYFLMGGDWLLLQDNFLSLLNEKIKSYALKGMYKIDSPILKNWANLMSETDYNEMHKDIENTIIIHPNKHKMIELCDIINWDNENLYLYFVKQGFGSSIRDLSCQIYLSAKMLEQSLNSDNAYLRDFYQQIIANKHQTLNLAEYDFIALFKKKLNYVFAFYDKANTGTLATHPERFKSNIAKFSLVDLADKMNNMNKSFLKICQIRQ